MPPHILATLRSFLALPDADEATIRAAIAERADPIPGNLAVRFTPDTVDLEARTIEATIATDSPVRMFDYRNWEEVDEVLTMPGLRRDTLQQGMALLDTHHQFRCGDVLGSWDNLRVEGSEFNGLAVFSSVEQNIFTKAAEGHIRDISVGYHVHAATYLDPGTTAVIEGVSYTCADDSSRQLKVVTDWTAVEGSLVPIGADANAGTRSAAYTPPPPPPPPTPTRTVLMNPFEFALLSRGFSADDATRLAAQFEGMEQADALALIRTMNPGATTAVLDPPPAPAPGIDDDARAALRDEGRRQEAARCLALRGIYGTFLARTGTVQVEGAPAQTRTGQQLLDAALANADVTPDAARAQVLDFIASGEGQQNLGRTHITMGMDERDQARANLEASLIVRATTSQTGTFGSDEEYQRGRTVGRLSLSAIASACLRSAGVGEADLRGLNNLELVGAAFTSRLPGGRALPGQTTSDFPSILENIANKLLVAGYNESEATYRQWCYIDDVPDFKSKSILGLSNLSILEEVPEGDDFNEYTLSEQKETVQAKTYGNIVSFTRQAIINDDLNAFARVAFLLGQAALRTVNRLAVIKLLANANTAYNSNALTSTENANLVEGTAYDPTTTEKAKAGLNAMKKTMRVQTGQKGEILNVVPSIVLAGPTAEDYVLEAISDTSKVDMAQEPNRALRGLTPVIEPYLEDTTITGNSATAMYMFTNPMVIPVIVAAFLNGNENPYLERKTEFCDDGFKTKGRHDVGIGQNDHRGIVASTGIA